MKHNELYVNVTNLGDMGTVQGLWGLSRLRPAGPIAVLSPLSRHLGAGETMKPHVPCGYPRVS